LPAAPLLFTPVYACELRIQTPAVLKGKDAAGEVGATVPVVTYLISPECSVDYLNKNVQLDKPALWLLRVEAGFVRTLVDNAGTVYPLNLFSEEAERRIHEWNDPIQSVIYLFLKPGVMISQRDYAEQVDPGPVIDLGGWTTLLRVYRAIYLESNDEARGQIALVAAGFGHCVPMARRVATVERRLEELQSRNSFLKPDVLQRDDDVNVGTMAWKTKNELLADFQSPMEAVDELTQRACSSGPRTKMRAREVLTQYFAVNPSTLPCIPCE
jgi:hypothetical protein